MPGHDAATHDTAGPDLHPDDVDALTAVFQEHRGRLFAVAHRMVGSVADAEDVLQEVWLGWVRGRRDEVGSPQGYLVRATVNRSLDRLASPARQREVGIPTWLPEPAVTAWAPEAPDPADAAQTADSVSLALLVVLETLSPLERAVFVLREAFGYEHAEIAAMLDRSPAAVRQLAHRAREHVRARRPRFATDVDEPRRRALTERFVRAAQGGDLTTLMRLLAPDVEFRTDGGGGRVQAARQVVRGRDKVVRLLSGLVARGWMPPFEVRPCRVNGGPGHLLVQDGWSFGVVVVELSPGGTQVQAVYAQLDPLKLPDPQRPPEHWYDHRG